MKRSWHSTLLALAVTGLLAATLAAATAAGAQGEPGAPTCGGSEATIVGTDGDDVLVGTPGDDVIWAGLGDDSIVGLGGKDIICGGSGDDEIRGGSGKDSIYGQRGADLIVGGRGWDHCVPGPGRDTRIRCEEKIVAEANGPLGGAGLGTDPTRAIKRMTQVFGQPTDDSGWIVGCPFDSETATNERLVQWGSLRAFFYGDPGNRTFVSWDYFPIDGRPQRGGPEFTDIVLPGEFVIGDPLQSVADALGVAVEPGMFGEGLRATAPGGGLEASHRSGDPTDPILVLRVGDYLVCE